MESLENSEVETSKNSEMDRLKENLKKDFDGVVFFKEWPASKPDAEKTDVVWKYGNDYIKGFTRRWRILWETEYELINLFNHFSIYNDSNFSWPDVSEVWETEDGWYYFWMKDVKKWGLKELDFSNMSMDEIMKLYNEYRQTFNEFEKYSKWEISMESNPTLQKIYSLSNRYKNNILFNLVWNPALKLVIGKRYSNKINERMSNGWDNVRACGLDFDKEKINNWLERLLSKVDNVGFEYNFWRFWTWHVFSDWNKHKFVDFDNVGYQIKWTEIIWIMWSNVLNSVWKYDTYNEWKNDYDGWYNKLLGIYKDDSLVKLLLFVKLVWTVFEDYGHLIYKREVLDKKGKLSNDELKEKKDEIKKWVERNYRALQELMEQ